MSFDIPGTSFTVSISLLYRFAIDSVSVYLTIKKIIKDQKALTKADKKETDASKQEKIESLLKDCMTTIPLKNARWSGNTSSQVKIGSKTSSQNDESKQHRSWTVSGSHISSSCYRLKCCHVLLRLDKDRPKKPPQQKVYCIQTTFRIRCILSSISQPRTACIYPTPWRSWSWIVLAE